MEKDRNATLDVVKGLIVLTLPVIHTVLFYCNTNVQESAYGHVLAFIAEQAAPAFMLVMGIVVTIGKPRNSKQIIKRAGRLLLLGYLLNLFKFIIPELWSGLPANLFLENGIQHNSGGLFRLFVIEDILQLAAIGYLVCAFLYRLNRYGLIAGLFSISVVLFSPVAWKLNLPGSVFKIPLALVDGLPPDAFFPIFPWITYPLTGLVVGYMLRNYSDEKSYLFLSISGIVLILLGIVGVSYEPLEWHSNFYRLGPSGTCFHIGSAFLMLCLCHFAFKFFISGTLLSFLTTFSRQITFVYMIQWIIVGWGLSIFGYHKLEISEALLPIIVVLFATVSLTYLFSFGKEAFSKWGAPNVDKC